ncbi:MAG: glucosamine-6-phosphate deaminase [Planctomycetes bacterium]|nr:glucosamine-6-phosphate deaminase [Planctomycetota bacterium]
MPSSSSPSKRPEVSVLDAAEAARVVAREIAELVRSKAARGERTVLGLATGKTPMGVYRELLRLHREQGLSFARVTTFNLDEFVGLRPDDPRSFRAWMRRELFDHVDLDPAHAHVPDGSGSPTTLDRECERYRERIRAAGGLDLQLLGIGKNGHIAFNEPGSSRDSRMRVVELAPTTRASLAAEFGALERVPIHGLTLGVADVLAARAIRLLAFGEGKRAILERALQAPIGPDVPATFLREHADVRWIADAAAAGHSR